MQKIVIHGGRQLRGTVRVSGSKNAGLPLLFATLLTAERCTIRGLPRVADITTTLRLLERLGVAVADGEFTTVTLDARTLTSSEAPYELVKTMRASFLALGPLLARTGQARVSTPGGCAIGSRPIDIHLAGLERMGAEIRQRHGYVEARSRRLRGAKLLLDFPSVGATENLMMAAALADGVTTDRERRARARDRRPRGGLDRDGREDHRRRHARRSPSRASASSAASITR